MKIVYRLRKAIFVLTFFFFERVKLTAKSTCRIEFHVSSSLPACGSICLFVHFIFLAFIGFENLHNVLIAYEDKTKLITFYTHLPDTIGCVFFKI